VLTTEREWEMKVDFEDVSAVKKKINVRISAETVDGEIENAYRALNKKAKIKGFRPGKIPRDILVSRFKEDVEADVAEALFKKTYPEALKEADVNPISYPQVDTDGVKTGEDFSYSVTVEILPEIHVSNYQGLEVEKERVDVDKKKVEETLARLAEGHATLEPVEDDRPVKEGDFVIINFEAFVDDAPVEGGKAEKYPLEVGSGMISDDFEKKLVGKKPKEPLDLEVDFPEDHPHDSFKGQRVRFSAEIDEIKKKKIPAIDDDFAKDVGEFESLKALKEKIEQDLDEREQGRVEGEFRNRILKKLIEKNPFEVPEVLINQRALDIVRNTELRLRSQGLTLEAVGADPKKLMENATPQAEFDVKSHLIADEIAKAEDITVTKVEAQERLKKDAEASGMSADDIEKRYDEQGLWPDLMAQMRVEKTLDFLAKIVKIKEVKKITSKE
jgi:trigger factor